MKIKGGVLVCNPIDKEHSISKEKLDKVIQKSLQNAKFKNVKGKDLTPFLLSEVQKLTSGESLESNINLMLSNAKLSSKIAKLFLIINHFIFLISFNLIYNNNKT